MVYMSPLGKGVSRPQANWNQGWGTPDAAFWCCYGTAIESFAKLGDSIYFHSLGPSSSAATPTLSTPAASSASTLPSVSIPTLWIAQFISSDLAWDAAGMKVSQEAAYVTLMTLFLFHSRTQIDGVPPTPLETGFGARHQSLLQHPISADQRPLGSVASYLIYADVWTFR